jgi:hypothetical protein
MESEPGWRVSGEPNQPNPNRVGIAQQNKSEPGTNPNRVGEPKSSSFNRVEEQEATGNQPQHSSFNRVEEQPKHLDAERSIGAAEYEPSDHADVLKSTCLAESNKVRGVHYVGATDTPCQQRMNHVPAGKHASRTPSHQAFTAARYAWRKARSTVTACACSSR